MRFLFLCTALVLAAATVTAGEMETGSCVQKLEAFQGVIVSKIVMDPHGSGRKWCFVYTAINTVNAWLDELQPISCEAALEHFPKSRSRKLFQWLGGGPNPLFTDKVERSE